ncbi:hypothetical protein QR680_007487 [Steinernema hermaphroditum]|uniref:Uncharacterized protein n=1 Tax=Steinernema hermaphroditum TaxID=289476 RepID=A0AA39IDA8_9BILA|nr:hypothetical protein QR680_007487 [Steinernema hermaphroditum]
MFSGHYENLLQFNISFSVDMHRENGNDPSTVETFICELLRMNSEPPKKETSYEMRLKGSKLLAKKLDLTRGIFKKFGIYVQLMYSGKESQKAAVSRGSTVIRNICPHIEDPQITDLVDAVVVRAVNRRADTSKSRLSPTTRHPS